MIIQQILLSNLVPYEKNAKKHSEEQIEKLAKEISDIGWTQPIVVDHKMNIVVGHGRRLAAIKLGLNSVPVIVLSENLPNERIRAIRIFDNKIQDTGFDIGLLNQELFELSNLPNFDIKLTGFELPKFEPDLPDNEHKPKSSVEYVLRIVCENEDEQQELFDELKERGYKVKV